VAGGVRIVATLHPNLVNTGASDRRHPAHVLTIFCEMGGKQRVEISVEDLLPALTFLLSIAAVLHLWRERSLVRARRDFVASVSHELRTPLAQIRMFTETLQLGRERNAEERQAWLNIIGREAPAGRLPENILLSTSTPTGPSSSSSARTWGADRGGGGRLRPAAEQRGMRIWPMRRRASSMVDPAMRQVIVNCSTMRSSTAPPGRR
jgi:hypothetical protein